jgi:AraC-like DNA-binding protein
MVSVGDRSLPHGATGMSVLEPRRTALFLKPLVDVLDELEADADALLSRHELSRKDIGEASRWLPVSVVFDLFRQAERITSDPTVGVRAGLLVPAGVLYEHVVRTAATLGQAMVSAAETSRLVDDTFRPSMRIEQDRAVLEYLRYEDEPDALAEFALVALCTIGRHVTGKYLTPDRIAFRRRSGADPKRFARILGYEPVFGAAVDALEFPAALLALPIKAADAELEKTLNRHAQELLARLPDTQACSDKVRELIAAELRGGNPSIAWIADKLQVSPRTLRRRLLDEQTTFQALLDDLRRNLADRYLQEDVTVSEVSLLLGFSHRCVFIRAFRRWYGTSPETRKKHKRRKPRAG